MASANSTPTRFAQSQCEAAVLTRPRVETPSQRPSTSGGETSVEPKSDFLREALRERKGLTSRSQASTPPGNSTPRMAPSQLAHDEYFLPSSDEESKGSASRSSARSLRSPMLRRGSDVKGTKPSPGTLVRNLGLREADAQMDKLLKENWSLKHRLTLHEQAYSTLRQELDEALEQHREYPTLREKNSELEEAMTMISKQAAKHEEENKSLKIENADLWARIEDLVCEMEAMDQGIYQRQLAIEEAAGIIQRLEDVNEKLRKQFEDSPRSYVSRDTDSISSLRTRPTTGATAMTDMTGAPDSDYFSADSPSLTPTRSKTLSDTVRESNRHAQQLERAQVTGAAFNREIGLQSQVSKDSLVSYFLERPGRDLATRSANQALRRRSQFSGSSPIQVSNREQLLRSGTPPWSNARDLRAIHETGALHQRLGSSASLDKLDYAPTVTVMGISRPSSPDFLGMPDPRQRSIATPSRLASTAAEHSAETLEVTPLNTFAGSEKHSPALFESMRPPVGRLSWSHQLPDWAPSAELRNHGFLLPQPRAVKHIDSASRPQDTGPPHPPTQPLRTGEPFSDAHLVRPTSQVAAQPSRPQFERTASAGGALATPPSTPASTGLLARARSLHRTPASVAALRFFSGGKRAPAGGTKTKTGMEQ